MSTPATNSNDDVVAPLTIPTDIHREMVARCQREAPLESCGILGGIAPFVSSIHPLKNSAASETRYNADPHDLIEAYLAIRKRGAAVLAIYHSHPRWPAVPSRTDLEENHWGEVPRIIVSLLGETPNVRVWKLLEDSYEELPWRLLAPSGVAVDQLPRGG